MGASALSIIKNNYEARASKMAELREIDEAATGREYDADETAKVSELRSELDAIDGRIQSALSIEMRTAEITDAMGSLAGMLHDRERGDVVDMRSLGERFAEDEQLRSWANAGARGTSPQVEFDMNFRAVTDVTTGATSGGAFVNNQRLTRIGNDFIDRKTFLIDLLPTIRVSTGSVEVVQDQSPLADLANKAVEVTEGSAKPQAGPTLAVVTEPIQTIAAWVNITRQVAADAPQVMDYLDNKLRYSVKRRADSQIIQGNGTSPNISGMLDRSGINTYTAPAGSEEAYVSIRKAITTMELDEAVPEILVLNPDDAEKFDLANHADDGLHAVPNVAGPSARTAWGMRVVRSTAVAPLTGVLIDPMAVAVLDRQQVTAYMTDSHASLFISNILTLLLEARLGLAVFEPAGICQITFDYTA